MIKGVRIPIRMWAPAHEVDSQVIKQLKAVSSLPWVVHHVAVMPDVHAGKGATVGSVIASKGAIAPAAVGVDIGCGMAAVRTSLTARSLPDSLRALRFDLERAVAAARGQHARPIWSDFGDSLTALGSRLLAEFGELAGSVQSLASRAEQQLGTLGGGNHFVELCIDTEQHMWVMLHSGSRFIGAALAEYHMEKARHLGHNQDLPDPDLAAFLEGTTAFDAYRRDLSWAQRYAEFNRRVMLGAIARTLRAHFAEIAFDEPITCNHNYVVEECHFGDAVWVTRKGAIRAGNGELGIIPGSMGAKSFIVRGKGNPLSFESASHGAGRRLSRGQARRQFSVRDLERQTRGVECRKDASVLDEAPKAYKDIDRVMAQQADLVEIVAELKQIVCVKG